MKKKDEKIGFIISLLISISLPLSSITILRSSTLDIQFFFSHFSLFSFFSLSPPPPLFIKRL